jgi:hypothetical protein
MLFCLLACNKLYGCMRSLAEVQIPTSFRITVVNEKEPVAGIQIAIYDASDPKDTDNQKPILRVVSGNDGSVQVGDLHPGRYIVQTEGPGQGSAVYAIVSANQSSPASGITLQWPFTWQGILKTRSLTGKLASNNPWKPFEKIHVELWTSGAALPLAITDPDTQGDFHFSETDAGIYILRVRAEQKRVSPEWQVAGDIPIELLPNDKTAPQSLTLYLSESSCGMQYNSCPIPAAEMLPSRRLQVHDPLGAVIALAKFRVLSPTGAEMASGATDSNGIVELPSELKGKVTLEIASPGFALFILPLDLITPDDPAPYLFVEMGVQGYGGKSCSTASLEKNATPQ